MRRAPIASAAFAFFIGVIAAAVQHRGLSQVVAGVYGATSLLAIYAYWWDKRQARLGLWRTPEATLHLIELCGGWPGALAAQRWFRHKNRKVSFQVTFWLIVAAHFAIWACAIHYSHRRATSPAPAPRPTPASPTTPIPSLRAAHL